MLQTNILISSPPEFNYQKFTGMIHSKQSILVTGSTGFVGRALVRELIDRNKFNIVCLTRRYDFSLPTSVSQLIIEDLAPHRDLRHVFEGIDIVVHLAGLAHVMSSKKGAEIESFRRINVELTSYLARHAAEHAVKRFLFISSIKAQASSSTIGSPISEVSQFHPTDAYGVSKYEAELMLKELAAATSMEFVIIRPPLVYGSGVKANMASLIKLLRIRIPLPLGLLTNKRSFISSQNLCDFIVKCIVDPRAANEDFNISDGEDLTPSHLARLLAEELNVTAVLLPIPKWIIDILTFSIGRRDIASRICENLQIDTSKACSQLEWHPPISVREGMRKMMEIKE